jgi:hypothetical protein
MDEVQPSAIVRDPPRVKNKDQEPEKWFKTSRETEQRGNAYK